MEDILSNLVKSANRLSGGTTLEPGHSYLILDSSRDATSDIFNRTIKEQGSGGTYIGRNVPESKRNDVTYFWLTDLPKRRGYMPPKLEHIQREVDKASTAKKGAIMIDGLSYLITYSGDLFDPTLGFIRKAVDVVKKNGELIFLANLDPFTLDVMRFRQLAGSFEVYNNLPEQKRESLVIDLPEQKRESLVIDLPEQKRESLVIDLRKTLASLFKPRKIG